MDQLTESQLSIFIDEGFVRLDNAFPTALADDCRAILWKASQYDPNRPDTWVQPVIRIGEIGLEPFKKAANITLLLNTFDQLAGKGNWIPRSTPLLTAQDFSFHRVDGNFCPVPVEVAILKGLKTN